MNKVIDFIKNTTKSAYYSAKKGICSLLFPEGFVCIGCEKELVESERRYSLCQKCFNELEYRSGNTCVDCGSSIEEGVRCRYCAIAKPKFDKVYAPFQYSGVPKKMIMNYKDGGSSYLYLYIARHLIDYYKAIDIRPDYLCYVPCDNKTVRRRGFEHNKRVAEAFSTVTELKLIYPLFRAHHKTEQKGSRRQDRFYNIIGAFEIHKNFDKDLLKGKNILLLDDVVTTYATVNEAAKTLKEAGAESINILAFARR